MTPAAVAYLASYVTPGPAFRVAAAVVFLGGMACGLVFAKAWAALRQAPRPRPAWVADDEAWLIWLARHRIGPYPDEENRHGPS